MLNNYYDEYRGKSPLDDWPPYRADVCNKSCDYLIQIRESTEVTPAPAGNEPYWG